jgi:hypothetical protein
MSAIWLTVKEFLTSKKFIVAVVGIILSLAARYNLNLDAAAVESIVYIVIAYLIGQGWADAGKEAAKVQGTVTIATEAGGEPAQPVKDKLV